ncbi:MAG: hypothetical protein ACREXP_25070 [Steroidobacteraceae bacterium]
MPDPMEVLAAAGATVGRALAERRHDPVAPRIAEDALKAALEAYDFAAPRPCSK